VIAWCPVTILDTFFARCVQRNAFSIKQFFATFTARLIGKLDRLK